MFVTGDTISLTEVIRLLVLMRCVSCESVTDAGRGRAWLRSALNENSLKRYLMSMTDESMSATVEQFYEDWAVISCEESIRCLIEAAGALESILFAVNIDKVELNFGGDDESAARSRKKESEDQESVSPVYSSSPAQIVRKAAPRIVCLAEDDSYDSDGPISRQVSSASYSSTPNASELEPNNKLMLTPLEEDVRSVSGLSSDDRTSNDLELERELTSSDEVQTTGDEKRESMTQDLEQEVIEVRSERDQLSSQLNQMKRSHAEQLSRYESLIQSITKENDILKVQVKKYLSAIQMLDLKDGKSDIVSQEANDLIPSYVLYQEVSYLLSFTIRTRGWETITFCSGK